MLEIIRYPDITYSHPKKLFILSYSLAVWAVISWTSVRPRMAFSLINYKYSPKNIKNFGQLYLLFSVCLIGSRTKESPLLCIENKHGLKLETRYTDGGYSAFLRHLVLRQFTILEIKKATVNGWSWHWWCYCEKQYTLRLVNWGECHQKRRNRAAPHAPIRASVSKADAPEDVVAVCCWWYMNFRKTCYPKLIC